VCYPLPGATSSSVTFSTAGHLPRGEKHPSSEHLGANLEITMKLKHISRAVARGRQVNHLVATFRAPVEHFRVPRVIDHLEMLVRAGGLLI